MNEIHASTRVSADHPSLPGHFPGQPIVPGVVLLNLVLDAIRQAHSERVVLRSIISTKFIQAVGPATQVDMHIKLTPDEQPGRLKARFTATHADAPVLEGSFLLELAERVS